MPIMSIVLSQPIRLLLIVFALFSMAASAEKLPTPVDKVVVEKSSRKMRLYSGASELAVFPVSLGRSPAGAKECEGDNKTPEGVFRVLEHKRDSAYFLSLRLSYPEPVNVASAAAKGCKPGSDVMIHGMRNGFGWLGRAHLWWDWTRGCIAVTNEEMTKIWALVPDGAVVEIKP